ncbi:sulfatase-like hydrolase/transferase [Puniceicoccales bacterium CK1056]|uniref:Sulfatase-like hydrolase/transferase n=1 Tax=Oceanipulchritudo coccoides TaxID=2706888 RepID=A0A6B2LYA3_9BACT|nr:sulfatase-like hydrolase/transferase [Oceanipulchritudo coccoides]NDV61611.1 sulfatase-like hydrolase/transferase [Oceanipulchritudo coccoides]
MNMTPYIRGIGLLCVGLMSFNPLIAKAPNLVVILTDDQGYQDVGFNGCEDIPTPNIDSIASNGIRFTNGYVSYPVCGPSRAGLLTGRYQGRFGFTTNPTIDPAVPHAGIPLEEKNIAEVLSPVGYRSMIIGKWHMGSHPQNHPLNRGFDEFFGFLSGGHNYFPENYTLNDLSEVKKKWDWYRTKLIHNRERVDIEQYLTDELSDRAVAFVERQACSDSPFFLYLAYNAPHTPLQATEKYLSRFTHIKDKKRRTYAAMVSSVDDGVGALLSAIEEKGLTEETIILFLSDNGGATNNASRNLPLRGNKGTMWEGGVRVPFAMQWKGQIPEGIDYDEPVISLDILPTIAALSNAPLSEERPLDGVNLIPYLRGEKDGAPHAQLTWRDFRSGGFAIRQGDLKLVREKPRTNEPKLYDLEKDISEKRDLRGKYANKADSMQAAWDEWESQLKPLAFPTLGDVWWEKN